jgi:hypothetical protein
MPGLSNGVKAWGWEWGYRVTIIFLKGEDVRIGWAYAYTPSSWNGFLRSFPHH